MGNLTLTEMGTELVRRVEQLSQPIAEAAINRALLKVHASGSYTFDLTGNTGGPTVPLGGIVDVTVGEFTLPDDCDIKKAMFVANVNGIPIFKVGVQSLWETYALNIPANEGYASYTIAGRTLLLRPGTAQNIGVRYHVLFVPLTGSQTSKLHPILDELVIDLAEAKERQIYDVGDVWVRLEEQTMAKITKELDGFLSVSQEPMPQLEAAAAIQEKTQLGRA